MGKPWPRQQSPSMYGTWSDQQKKVGDIAEIGAMEKWMPR